MATIVKKNERAKNGNMTLSRADRLAIKMGGRRFDVNEPFPNPGISDKELEDFLQWREDIRSDDVEAQRNWRD